MLVIDNLEYEGIYSSIKILLPFCTYIKYYKFNKIEYNSSTSEHVDMTTLGYHLAEKQICQAGF